MGYISESTNMKSDAKDLFGYYNGKTTNSYLAFLRLFEDNYTFQDETVADRSYNSTAVHALSLETITTGSGSKTKFIYGSNSVPTSGSGALFSTIGIGQRISSILTYDLSAGGETLIRTRSFTYNNPQLTIPTAYFDRRAFATVSESFREDLLSGHGWWNSDYNPIPRTCYVTFADQSVLPGVPLERAQIFYGEVTEVVSGPESGESVRTEYEYDVSGAALSASNGQWSLGSGHDSHDDSRNSYGSHSYHFFERPPYQIPRDSGLGPSIYFEPIRFHFIPEDRPQMTAPIEVRSYKRLAGSGAYAPVNTTHNTYAKTTENLRIGWRVRSMIAKGDEQCVRDTLCAVDFFREEILQRRVWHRLTNTTVTEYLDGNNSTVVFSTDYTYMQYSSGGNETVPAIGSILTPTVTTITVNGELSPRYARNNTYASGIAADSTWAASLANMGYRLPVTETVIAGATGSGSSVAQKRQTWKAFPISTWTNGTGSGSGSTMWEPYQSFIFRDGVKVGPSTYYTIYDGHGNPLEIQQEGQPVKTYVWGYGGLRPVAEIVGTGFNAVRNALTSPQRSTLNGITTSSSLSPTQLTFLRTTLRNALPGAMISVYTYDGPEYAMSSEEDPSGRKIYYSYDEAGRLASVKDEDGNLMEGYLYELTRGVQGLPNRILSLSYTASGATSLPNSIASALSASLSSLPAMKEVAYLDGLGRSVQSVSIGASTNGRDLVTPAVPDFLDREDARAYLPYPATTSSANVGSFRSGAVSAQQTYYNGQYGSGTKAYAENVYEMSSRNRVKESSLPGFSERTVLSTEGSPDDYLLKLSFNATNQTISANEYYDEGWFVINRTEGPDGSIIESWNDEFGTPVLERVRIEAAISSSPEKWAETRYIKDARGRVLCVIPPDQYESLSMMASQNGGVVNSFSADHCYTYQYDGRDRVIKRHLPDQVTETLTYNDADLVISTVRIAADGNGTETFSTEYDGFNRPVKEKYRYGNGSTITLIEYAYDSYPSTIGTGNSAQSVPTFSTVSGIATSSDKDARTKGFKTAERVRILPPGESESSMTADGNAQFIVRSFFYDKKGNVIQTAEARQDVGTTSRISTKYGFTGNVMQSRETVDLPAAGGGSALTTHIDKSFSYDSRVRLTDQTAQLTSGGTSGPQGSLGYTYDALGRNAAFTRGTGTSADTTPYTYTVQGWLKTADGTTYSETLYYQDASNTSGLPGKAGLITEWTTLQKGTTADGGTNVPDTYAYEYDGAGRLTGSTRYSGSSSTALTTLTEKDITYDESGNLLTIKRYDANSATTPVDDLTFTYTGTKRTGYSYDTHSNVTYDATNGVNLTWNVIGLPKSISDSTNTARRVYAADGTLLAVYEGTRGTTGRVYVGSLDILRASNGAFTVESAGWEGGRLLPGTGNDKVLYQITDHLGSVRVVKDGAGNVLQRIDYYPFGSVSAGWSSSTTPAQPTIRYRFSGKEIAGQSIGASAPAGTPAAAVGNPYLDFGARLYDPRTASWLAHDPLAEKYYGISPFAYCAGNPVNLVDPTGSIIIILYIEGGQQLSFSFSGVEINIPKNDYVQAVVEAYRYNKENWAKAGFVGNSPSTDLVERNDIKVYLYSDKKESSQYFMDNGGVPFIIWNPYEGSQSNLGIVMSPATILAHEADHLIDDLTDAKAHLERRQSVNIEYGNAEEKRVITGSEQKTALANGEINKGQVTRKNHNGTIVYTEGVTSNVIDQMATDYYKKYYKRR